MEGSCIIEVKQNILANNTREADEFRLARKAEGTFMVDIMGSPGAFCQLPSHTGQNNFTESHLRWLQQSYYRVGFEGITDGSHEYVQRKVLIDGFLYGVVSLFLDWLNDDMS